MSTFSVVKKVQAITALVPRPWLVVGKGPSCDFVGRVDEREYHVFTLNHACTAICPAIAHFVDLEAFEDCRPLLARMQATYCLPWHPHQGNGPGPDLNALGDRVRKHDGKPIGTLVSYNSSVAFKLPRNSGLPDVRLRYFSAVAAFNILALAGVKTVLSIGVDGGTGYAEQFDPKDRLANGRRSFDVQTREIERTVAGNGITWTRLTGEL